MCITPCILFNLIIDAIDLILIFVSRNKYDAFHFLMILHHFPFFRINISQDNDLSNLFYGINIFYNLSSIPMLYLALIGVQENIESHKLCSFLPAEAGISTFV